MEFGFSSVMTEADGISTFLHIFYNEKY